MDSLTYGGSKAEFMKLVQGPNVIRVMAQPVKHYVTWVDTPSGKRAKFNTPIEDPTLVDRIEEAGFKSSLEYMLKVLDRSSETFMLLEFGPQIFKGIRELVQNPKWGPVTAYDVTITKGPKGTQPLYSVTPNPKEPLTRELQSAWSEFNENLNIERLITPSDPKSVCEIMGWDPSSGGSRRAWW
jgi:hypothetical protein